VEQAVMRVVDPSLLAYLDSWEKIDGMLDTALSKEFRNQMVDLEGNGWVYNWFCVDHVGYKSNPRRRDLGYHHIFDHYRNVLKETGSDQDGLHFHFHPKPFKKEAHLCATHWWAYSDTLYQVLGRRIIERNWFPAVNRPGFHLTRPDSHWFLEQFIPFDMANQSTFAEQSEDLQMDISSGRFGDWRRAPHSWTPYHPSHDDYQAPGDCRRWIARCLNIGTRLRTLSQKDILDAFDAANNDQPVVMAFTNHDFRDITKDVERVRSMIKKAADAYPNVPFKFSEASAAMRSALQLPARPPCDLNVTLDAYGKKSHILSVSTREPSFGPQPYLAIKTKDGNFLHDNLDFQTPNHAWSYVLDEQTFGLSSLEKIGFAVNNRVGATSIAVMDIASGTLKTSILNPIHT